MTNVKSLLELYVKMGGSLTDTYSDIAGGVPVGQYSTISDAILACSKKYSSGGGGGGAEKFIVTLTQDEQTEEWTADKTIAEIVAAKAANKTIVANYLDTYELPCLTAASAEGYALCIFSGIVVDDGNVAVSVLGESDGSADAWDLNQTPIPTSTNAPLIVTLTAGQEAGQFVGDKTYKETYDAFISGCNVVFSTPNEGGIAEAVRTVGFGGTYYAIETPSFTCEGSANDYITVTVGG